MEGVEGKEAVEAMEAMVLKFAPETWNKSGGVITLFINDEEYKAIENNVREAVANNIFIATIQRIQNLFYYGQLLIREQLKISLYQSTSFYRVRRYSIIKTKFLEAALKHNLDHRRCGLTTLDFKIKLPPIQKDETILVVQVVTDSPEDQVIIPETSSDYFIEYVVKVG